jgi:polar amino acid transport system substrate-binding protein
MRLRTGLACLPLFLVPLAACAPADDSSGTTATDSETTSAPPATDSSAPSDGTTTAAPTEPASLMTPECTSALKNAGQLTVGTDKPAYDPWFSDNDPTNGKGYESAVAYAVAKQLGFDSAAVKWVKEPFNKSYAPGKKDFDFDINQISITPERAKVVTFSDGYYTAAQALIALKGSPVAKVTSLAGLKKYKLGAQTGTTSLTAIRNDINPSTQPLVFDDTNVAKQALLNHQVDAIVTDLPTAFYISAVQIPSSEIVGQFKQQSGSPEQFGMLFEQNNPLVDCVNQALANMKSDGTLDAIEQKWLSQTVSVPVLQ